MTSAGWAILFLAGLGGLAVSWIVTLATMDTGPEWLSTAGVLFGQVCVVAAAVGVIGGAVQALTS